MPDFFRLPKQFVDTYNPAKSDRAPAKFGFNGVGDIAYYRSYSRTMENGMQEDWHDTVERVVNGCFTMQLQNVQSKNFKWNIDEVNRTAMKMYDKIFNFKFLPPGRGLWALGTKLTDEAKMYAALNNCAFVSTKSQDLDKFIGAFTFLMDSSMMGVGVGFDTKGGKYHKIYQPLKETPIRYVVPDTRAGWVQTLKLLLETYFKPNQPDIQFDYTQIRPAGVALKTFGGVSAGSDPLKDMHDNLTSKLRSRVGQELTSRDIVDMMNIIGKCIISGNIRRVAEIALGEPGDQEFLALKDYEKNPERSEWGWVSNNSIYAETGMDYTDVAEKIRMNGEPGLCWLDNMRSYGRMCESPNYKDYRVAGGNPCLEQSLESHEMCCLVETFPANHDNYQEFQETLEMAFLYGKTITLGLPYWKDTAEVMARNRRIGTSISGIAQFIGKKGTGELVKWCNQGYRFIQQYDKQLSHKFNVNESIKVTSIKPSGTVSLLAGATPGVHFPHAVNYIRRIRLSKQSPLVEKLIRANYHVEDDVMDRNHSHVVEIPVSLEQDNTRSLKTVTMWEQLQLASLMQQFWADNQVSCTVTFDPETEGKDIKNALEYYQYSLKGISFLPKKNDVYPQMPYEEITKEQYLEKVSKLKTLNLRSDKPSENLGQPKAEQFCDSDHCAL